MKIVVTRAESIDNQTFNHYKSVRAAIKYGILPYAAGKACRAEIYPNDKDSYKPCKWILNFDANGKRIFTRSW